MSSRSRPAGGGVSSSVLVDGIVEVAFFLSVPVTLLSVVETAVVPLSIALVDGIMEVTYSSVLVTILSVVVMLVVRSEVVLVTVSSSVVETAVVLVTAVLVDGVEEVSFSFTPSPLQWNHQFPVGRGKFG